MIMKEVTDDPFGSEQEWQEMRDRITHSFIEIGKVFGDDETIMRAKADRFCQMLRGMGDEVPSLEVRSDLSPGFDDKQIEIINAAVREAVTGINDLRTSKLEGKRND